MDKLTCIEPTINQLIKDRGIDITPSISQIIHQAYIDAGFKNTDDQDKILLINRFSAEIKEYYQHLTGKEIRKAIHDGILGRYGEYTGINLRTLCRFLDKYLESDQRQKFLAQRKQTVNVSRQLAERGSWSKDDALRSLYGMINYSYSRYLQYKPQPALLGIKRVGDTMKVFDPNGRIKAQLVKDNLASPDESLEQIYARFKKEGKEKIYN